MDERVKRLKTPQECVIFSVNTTDRGQGTLHLRNARPIGPGKERQLEKVTIDHNRLPLCMVKGNNFPTKLALVFAAIN